MKKTKRKILALSLVVIIVIMYVAPTVHAGRFPGDLYYQVYICGKSYEELEMSNDEIEALNEYVKLQRCKLEDLYFVSTNINAVFDGNADLQDDNIIYDYCKKQYEKGKASYLLELLPESQYAEITATDTGDLITSGVKQLPKQLDKSTGELSFSDEYIEDIKDYLNYYIQETQPYYIIPGKGDECMVITSRNDRITSIDGLGRARRFVSDYVGEDGQFIFTRHSRYCGMGFKSPVYYASTDGTNYDLYDSNAEKVPLSRLKWTQYAYLFETAPYNGNPFLTWCPCSAEYYSGGYSLGYSFLALLPASVQEYYNDQLVFKTYTGLKEYLLSGKKETVYTGTVYNGDIKNINKTINYNTYVNTDWEKLNEQTYQKIVDAINDQGGNLSRKEIQKIIDDNISEVTDAIEQSTGDVQKTLNRDTKKMLDVLEDNRTWLAAIYNSVKKGADTLENIESILNAGFNETIVCNMRTTHSQLDALQTSLVSESAIISTDLQKCYNVLTEIKNTPGSGYGELDAEKVERLLSSIDVLSTRTLCVDSQILRGLFGDRVDADGVVNVDGGALYDVLVDVRNELKSNGGLMQDIRQLVLDVKSRNININVTTPDDGEGIISRLLNVLSPLTDELKKKFPFSIPWDIGICINLLSAEPEAPVLKYKTKVKAGDKYISGETEIDFKDYKKVRDVAQGFQVVLFAGILIALSRKLFMNGGGNNDS